jgi:hypothetical protein
MTNDGLRRMLDFLEFLGEKGIEFRMEQQRPEAVMVKFVMVGYRVEVEFFEEGIEYSVFTGDESVEVDEKKLYDLINEKWY